MLTRKVLLLTATVGFAALLAGCTSTSPGSSQASGLPATSASAGVQPAPTSAGSTAPSGSPTPSSAPAADSSSETVQQPTTGGDDQRAAELVVMSYFDNLLVGDSAKAQRLVNPSAAATESASFVKRIISEKLISYRVSGQQPDPRNTYTVVRVHYTTQAHPGDQTIDVATEENQLESTWQIEDVNYEAFSDTSP